MTLKMDPATVEIITAWAGLAELYRRQADTCMSNNDAHGVYHAIADMQRCYAKARQLETRHCPRIC